MMLWVVFLGLFLMCAGMSVVFMVYTCVLWCASIGDPPSNTVGNSPKASGKGLSEMDLERLPGVEDGGLVEGMECAVCLDDIEEGQPARVMPECRHAFHRRCADAWLSTNAVCPICRARLVPLPAPLPAPLPPEPQIDAV